MNRVFGTNTTWFVGALLLCAVAVVAAQPTTLSLNGSVRGADGLPKRLARVQLEGPANYLAITNTRGEFSISNVQPGRYVATVTQGDNVQKVSVSVTSNPAPVNITVKW